MQYSDNEVRRLSQMLVVATLVVPHVVHISWTKPGMHHELSRVPTAMPLGSSGQVPSGGQKDYNVIPP
jgi:hypothetical protein